MEKKAQDLNGFRWVDLISPTKEEMDFQAKELKISRKVLYNCLDPDYLPHVETHGEALFMLVRLMEPGSPIQADSVQELTTKVAVFIGPTLVVTIRRLPLREISEIQKKAQHAIDSQELDRSWLMGQLMEQVALGFDNPLNELEKKLDAFEEKVFQNSKNSNLLLEGYYIRRKATAFKKVLKLTIDSHIKIMTKLNCSSPLMQDSRERLDRNLFYAEDVYENIQSLLNTQLSLQAQRTNEASFRTNEIMRVLTVLSLFFLPLNFIAGVFGMNFEQLPLLKLENGFWISMISMLIVCVLLGVYVVRKGWLRDRPQLPATYQDSATEKINEVKNV